MPLETKTPTKSPRGGSGRGRGKNPAPTWTPAPTSAPLAPRRNSGNGLGEVTHFRAENLSEIQHGLQFPTFDTNQYFASDLFSDSSSLQRTSREDADAALESIGEKRNTMEVVSANLDLNTDVLNAGIKFQKFVGKVIDYGKILVDNQTRFINYQTAGVHQMEAQVNLEQAHESLSQADIALRGMQNMTVLVEEEWVARQDLKKSQVNALRIGASRANAQVQAGLSQLKSDFRNDLQLLGA